MSDWLKKDLTKKLAEYQGYGIELANSYEDMAEFILQWIDSHGPPPSSMQLKELIHENEELKKEIKTLKSTLRQLET